MLKRRNRTLIGREGTWKDDLGIEQSKSRKQTSSWLAVLLTFWGFIVALVVVNNRGPKGEIRYRLLLRDRTNAVTGSIERASLPVEKGRSGQPRKRRQNKKGRKEIHEDDGSRKVKPAQVAVPPELRNKDRDEMSEQFQCNERFYDPDRPINHKWIWKKMHQVYVDVMEPEISIRNRLLQEDGASAMRVPYSVKKFEGKGLGLVAEADIIEGSIIDNAKRGGRVEFHSGFDFRRFVAALPSPYMKCLVMQCSTVELPNDAPKCTAAEAQKPLLRRGDKYIRENAFIAVDLDDSCFANEATDDGIQLNVKSDNPTPCDYARRDIKAGEELLWSYDDYSMDGWDWFGL
mmetsp:Transcript_33467/g.69675  ORF Transcript_33467/g.69675 Transcript_33467/m.69675 type:complete len:346 (+) Transcript_33467:54-1091(+)